MNEWDVLEALADSYGVGEDCAVIMDGVEATLADDVDEVESGPALLLTTDMLHDATDFPDGVTVETMGWRAAAASLSDVAAMGGEPIACVLVVGTPDLAAVEAVAEGAAAVCDDVGCTYAGGDVDRHDETTLVSTVLGRSWAPVTRRGASVGDAVVVTGALGRTAVGLRAFDDGDAETGNELFRFNPRVVEGRALAPHASAMIDSSDGLAVSLHQLAEASDVGVAVHEERLPAVEGAEGPEDTVFTGEDYELVATVPGESLEDARDAVADTGTDTPVTVIGECVAADDGVSMDGERLPRRGYEH